MSGCPVTGHSDITSSVENRTSVTWSGAGNTSTCSMAWRTVPPRTVSWRLSSITPGSLRSSIAAERNAVARSAPPGEEVPAEPEPDDERDRPAERAPARRREDRVERRESAPAGSGDDFHGGRDQEERDEPDDGERPGVHCSLIASGGTSPRKPPGRRHRTGRRPRDDRV